MEVDEEPPAAESPKKSQDWRVVWAGVGALIVAIVLLSAVIGGDDEGDSTQSGGGSGGDANTPLTKARVRGDCPGFLSVGAPTRLTMRITNTGTEDWPVTFVSFFDGLDHFVVNNARLGALVGRDAHTPSIDTYRFGTGAGLEAAESGVAQFLLTPIEAGNTELRFGAWGGRENQRRVPNVRLVACEDLAINP